MEIGCQVFFTTLYHLNPFLGYLKILWSLRSAIIRSVHQIVYIWKHLNLVIFVRNRCCLGKQYLIYKAAFLLTAH